MTAAPKSSASGAATWAAVKRAAKALTGENPMPRLHLAFTLAQAIGSIGIIGILFGAFGAFLKTISVIAGDPSDSLTWGKVGEMLDKSAWRTFTGYGAAAVIHAVAKLYEKAKNETRPN